MPARNLTNRARVIELRRKGLKPAEICRQTGLCRSFVVRWVSVADAGGDSTGIQRPERPRKLTSGVAGKFSRLRKWKKRRSARKVYSSFKKTPVFALIHRKYTHAAFSKRLYMLTRMSAYSRSICVAWTICIISEHGCSSSMEIPNTRSRKSLA
jgi:hypothetical protein